MKKTADYYKVVPVSERLPKDASENYMTISEHGFERLRFFNGKRFESAHYEGEITHWLEKQYATQPAPVEQWICNADCPDVNYGSCCHPSDCQKKPKPVEAVEVKCDHEHTSTKMIRCEFCKDCEDVLAVNI